MKVLIFGVSGMLGSTIFREFYRNGSYEVLGICRKVSNSKFFDEKLSKFVISGISIDNSDDIISIFSSFMPDIVINCVGLVKQNEAISNSVSAISVNSLFPHRLASICNLIGARFIQISTDCVFSGADGMYNENHIPDANDLYGRSKLLGEVVTQNALTLRTSIIGHGMTANKSLVDWFLSQGDQVKGFKRAVFSGFPTIVLANILNEMVIPNRQLWGLYHVASDPIDKYSLLCLISKVYGREIEIIEDDNLMVDRSLDATLFSSKTGYTPPDWEYMIELMYADYLRNYI